jgi:hypothetical protein
MGLSRVIKKIIFQIGTHAQSKTSDKPNREANSVKKTNSKEASKSLSKREAYKCLNND